jgi:hypothetical protein
MTRRAGCETRLESAERVEEERRWQNYGARLVREERSKEVFGSRCSETVGMEGVVDSRAAH